jgi:hypothetical protein
MYAFHDDPTKECTCSALQIQQPCGAVKAALGFQAKPQSTGSPHLDSLVSTIAKNIGQSTDPIKTQVSAVASDLKHRSKIVREVAEKGEFVIVRGYSGLQSGKVKIW